MLPTENIPIGLGDTTGSFSVSDDGEARYQIPLWVPPGRAGVEPSLVLSYGSGGGNGPLGVGWSLAGGSSISRCRRTLAQDGMNAAVDFSADDAFCLDGQHLVRVGTIGTGTDVEFRPEQSPGTRVVMHSDQAGPSFFDVYTRDGRISVYGSPPGGPPSNSRLDGKRVAIASAGGATDAVTTTHASARLSWAVSEVRDRAGNNLRWSYKITTSVGPSGEQHSEQLPTEISYTGFSGNSAQASAAPATRKVTFVYEPRTDREFSFVSGFGLKSTERLQAIVMLGPGLEAAGASHITQLRRYNLTYDNFSVSRRSLLGSVQECDGSGICRVPVVFQWELGCGIGTLTSPERIGTGCDHGSDANPSPFEDIDLGLPDVMKFSTNSAVWQSVPQVADLWTIQTADIDGDGRDDLLYRVPTLDSAGSALIKTNWVYRLSTGRGFGPPVTTTLPESKTGAAIEDLRTVDLDADGVTDVISVQQADPTRGTNGSYEAFKFNGTQFQSAGISGAETFQGWWNASTPTLFPSMHVADLDGDGRPELVRSAVNVQPFQPPTPGAPYKWAFRGNSSTSDIQLGGYASLGVTSGLDHASYVVDVNNDGAVDFLARDAGGTTAGDGFPPHYSALSLDAAGHVQKRDTALSGLPLELSVQLTSSGVPSWPSYHYFRPWFVDINGDRLPDAVAFREHQKVEFPTVGTISTIAGAPYVAINTGNGFAPYKKFPIGSMGEVSPIFDRVAARMVDPGVRPIDYNGDGRMDLLITDAGAGLSIRRQTFIVLQAKSDGSGFDTLPVPIPVGDTTSLTARGGAQDRGYGHRMTQLLDANGDGLMDVVQVVAGRVHLYLRKGKKPDVILRVATRPQTPAVEITYAPIGDDPTLYAPGTCRYPQVCLRRGMWVVARHRVENGLGGWNSWKHAYADGRLDRKGRGWLGFGRTTVTDEQLGATHTTTRDNVTTARLSPGAAPYLYPFAARPATVTDEVPVTSAPGAPRHRRTITTANMTKLDPTGRVLFAYPQTVTTTEAEGTTQPYEVHRATVDVDGYGNPTTSTQTAAATLNPTAPVDTQSSAVSYKNDAAAWLIGLPETVDVTSTTADGESKTRGWRYGYDPPPASPPASRSPRVTSSTHSPQNRPTSISPPSTPATPTVWSKVSSVRQRSRPNRERHLMDILHHTFPRKRTNAAGHEETMYYHSGLGVVVGQDDLLACPDVLPVRRLRDGFGKSISPVSAMSRSATVPGNGLGKIAGQAIIRDVAQSANPTHDPREVVIYDRLGRPSRLRHTSFGGGPSQSDLTYDRYGRLQRKSLPSQQPYSHRIHRIRLRQPGPRHDHDRRRIATTAIRVRQNRRPGSATKRATFDTSSTT